MKCFVNFFIFLFLFSFVEAKNIWLGEWVAQDKWQSEFSILINKDKVPRQIMVQVKLENGN